MDTDYMDDIHVALQSLLLLARMEELRAGSAADYSGAALDWDIQYECVYDLYNRAFDICAMSYSEAWCEERIYVSAHSMVEFYKLCREHAVLLRCKLEDEPYYKEAEEFVDNVMAEAAGYGYAWKLYTKVNHTGASGLLIRMAESFYDQSSMALEVSVIPEYYRDRCESLRGEIARCKADKTKLAVTGSKKKKRVRKAA